MIYISAQPDDIYFLWQLELQIFNFHSKGISNNQIHILVGYNPTRGIHPRFKEFANCYKEINIYFYPDMRKNKKYLSSIRPHLLAQHFRLHPKLEVETIFYHDSDILFTKTPNWNPLLGNDTWYVSDTRSYLSSKYIRQYMDEKEFSKMCSILSISPSCVKQHDKDSGGAQYILKRITASFWEKVEKDCELLYTYLYYQQKYGTRIHKDFQIWCTDMWVIWWNALLLKQDIQVHPLLDFSWADSPIEELKEKSILHYTGKNRKDIQVFNKTYYQTHSPFYADLSQINPKLCSIFVVNTIKIYKETLDKKRAVLSNIQFFITFDDRDSDKEKAELALKYYLRYWNVNVVICPKGGISEYVTSSSFQYAVCIPNKCIIPFECMKLILEELQINTFNIMIFNISLYQLDSLGIHIFSNVLDDAYLGENKGKTKLSHFFPQLMIYNKNGREQMTYNKKIDGYGI